MKRILLSTLAALSLVMNVSCSRQAAQRNTADQAATDVVSAQTQGNDMAQEAQIPFQWQDETVIEVRSDEDIARIEEIFDPLLEASDGEAVRAPLHAVVFVDSVASLKKAVSQFGSFGDEVTTFEFRFTAPVDNSEEEIHLHQVEGVKARLILSGVGDKPVPVSLLRFDLRADVIQLENLAWIGGSLPMSYVRAEVGQYLEMHNVTVSDNRYNFDQEPDASPMFSVKPSPQAEKILVSFDAVRFVRNQVHSLVNVLRRDGSEVRVKDVVFEDNVCFPGPCEFSGTEK